MRQNHSSQYMKSFFNFFNKPNGVYFNGELKYRNNFGVILSISILILLFFFIYLYIMYEEYHLHLTTTFKSNEYIDLSNIPILIRLLPKSGIHIFPGNNTFELKVEAVSQIDKGNKDNTYYSTPIKYQRCSTISDFDLLTKYYSRFNLNDFDCISPNQIIKMKGIYLDRNDNYTTLRISIKKCIGTKCDPEIEKMLDGAQFMIYYIVNEIRHNNPSHKIIQYSTKNIVLPISNNFYKRVSILFSKGKYTVLNFLNLQSYSKDFFTQTSYGSFNIDKVGLGDIIDNEGILGSIDFGLSGEILNYSKSSTFGFIILSYIGGWLYVLMTAGKVLDFLIGDKIQMFHLFEKVFDCDTYYIKKRANNIIVLNQSSYLNQSKYSLDNCFVYAANQICNKNKSSQINAFNSISINDKNKTKVKCNTSSQNLFNSNYKFNFSCSPYKKSFVQIRIQKEFFNVKNILFPLYCINRKNNSFSLLIFNSILSKILSLEAIYKVTKQNYHSMVLSEHSTYFFASDSNNLNMSNSKDNIINK